MDKIFPTIFSFLMFFVWVVPTHAGTLKGVIKYGGKVSAPAILKTGKYKKACGPETKSEALLVKNGGVMNAVVSLKGKKLKGKPGHYEMDQKKCRFVPHVIAMMKDSELELHSDDPINHNIHTYSFENDPINVMVGPGQSYSQEFEEPEIIKVECDIHNWMTAWIVVADNPFFAVSQKNGEFEIPDVPSGTYTLSVWHETLGNIDQKVKVGKGVTEVVIDFSSKAPQLSKR